MLAAGDPGEAAAAHELDHARQERRVAGAPDEARAHDDRLQALALGGDHGLLGARLGRAVERLRAGLQRRGLVDLHERAPGEQDGLGADVDEASHAGLGAGAQDVLRPLHVAALELLARARVAEHRGGVEGELAALGAGAQRGRVGQLPGRRLGAERAHALSRGIGTRERAHVVPLASQPLDQATADEARPTGYERGAHLGVS
jgi:hypothetical protein